MQTQLIRSSEIDPPIATGLKVAHVQFGHAEPFSFDLFKGFERMRVLTYSASIPMTVRMLPSFKQFECVFGYEGAVQDFGDVIAVQQILGGQIKTAVVGLEDERKRLIVEKVAEGQAKFYVVKGAIAHAKIYLLESEEKRRVIVGSANFSERAFSGQQVETLLVFDDDDKAWGHYVTEYETVRKIACSEFPLGSLEVLDVAIDEVPVIKEVEAHPVSILVHGPDAEVVAIPIIMERVERVSSKINNVAKAVVRPRGGKLSLEWKQVGSLIRVMKGQKVTNVKEEVNWLSVNFESKKVFISNREFDLTTDCDKITTDVAGIIEHFNNFEKGFSGDVGHHQKTLFMFMAWFYFSPFICDLRNRAMVHDEFIFDYPIFAILFGKSNSGKSELLKTLMTSMFGVTKFIEKSSFKGTLLRGLLETRRRFPVVFDDIERDAFAQHGFGLIKDETRLLPEYPAFVLLMNADAQSFPVEVMKRCLMVHTRASLPENSLARRDLYNQVSAIRQRLTSHLYREYCRLAIDRLANNPPPRDILLFSSTLLREIFTAHYPDPLPSWCTEVRMTEYEGRKYEKVRDDLLKMYGTNPRAWKMGRDEVILTMPSPIDSAALRRDIPDWIVRPGTRGQVLILDRQQLETLLGRRLQRKILGIWPR